MVVRLDRDIECEVLPFENPKAARTTTTTTTSPVHLDPAVQVLALVAGGDVELDVAMISFKDQSVPRPLRACMVRAC